jgi:RNAse (barnase) inhibitor barstar
MSTTPPRPDPSSPGANAHIDIRIDLAGCTDKATLLARFATALRFPDWFGHNWDALSDCLTDLSWLPARHYRVELAQAQALRTAAPETLDTALEILGEAAQFWANEGVVFEFALSETRAEDDRPGPGAPACPR